MFTLSYYARDNQLNNNPHYTREIGDVNDSRLLPGTLTLVSGDPQLSTEDIQRHFSNIEYYNSLLSSAKPRSIDYFARGLDYLLVKNPDAAIADADEAIALSNAYAPEHLIIQMHDYEALASRVVNAGSVFLGPYACESAGDYASGTNHTLPTHGYATAYSGVNLDSYCRKITFQHLTEEGIRHIGRAVELMAEAEQLDAHKNAMTVRINSLKK
jgi:hypothetical protein